MGPHDVLTTTSTNASTFKEIVLCYNEKSASDITSITIVTGVVAATVDASPISFDFETSTTSSLSISIDATGSLFATDHYDSIITSLAGITLAKLNSNSVTLTFDGSDIS